MWGSDTCWGDAAGWINNNVVQPVYNNVIAPAITAVATHVDTISHVVSAAAIVGVGCALGLISAGVTCVAAAGVALVGGVIVTAADIDRLINGSGGSPWNVALEVAGEVSGVEAIYAGEDAARAICWGLASGFATVSTEQIRAKQSG